MKQKVVKYETGYGKDISLNIDGYDFILTINRGRIKTLRSFDENLIGYDVIKIGFNAKYIRHSLLVDLVRQYFQQPEHKSWMYDYLKWLERI